MSSYFCFLKIRQHRVHCQQAHTLGENVQLSQPGGALKRNTAPPQKELLKRSHLRQAQASFLDVGNLLNTYLLNPFRACPWKKTPKANNSLKKNKKIIFKPRENYSKFEIFGQNVLKFLDEKRWTLDLSLIKMMFDDTSHQHFGNVLIWKSGVS